MTPLAKYLAILVAGAFAVCIAIVCEAVANFFREQGRKRGFHEGWIAGIEYERQRGAK